MAFIRKSGKTKIIQLPVTASTAIGAAHLVAFSSGKLIEATSSTAPGVIAGVLVKAIAATDADYAIDSRLVGVEVPIEKEVVWEADVTSGLVAADVGLHVDITDGDHIDRSASTYDIAKCVGVISSTKGLFVLNIGTGAKAIA